MAGATESSEVERLLRRDRAVTAAGLAVLCALAWLYVLMWSGSGLSAWDMTTLSLFPHRAAEAAGAMPCPAGDGRHGDGRHGGGAGRLEPRPLGAHRRHVGGHDGGDDDAERGPDRAALRTGLPARPGAGPCGGPGAGLGLRGRLPAGVARLRAGRRGAALGAGARGPGLRRDDGLAEPVAVRGRADRRGPLPALAAAERLPRPLPLACAVPLAPLARRAPRAPCGWACCTAPTASAAAGC